MKPTRKTNAALLAEIEDLQTKLAEAQSTLQANRSLQWEITERKPQEERILRLTSLYAVLSRVNEAIVRTDDEESLFREVCRIVAEEGGFPLVWIGQAKDRRVVPEAWSGPAEDYLKQIKVETEGKLGQGPTGTCIRENRPIVNDDFTTNPTMSPWREAALRYGFGASAAFPLRRGGKAVGAMTLYAPQPGVFDAEQVALLESLSADISYALDTLDQEQLRIHAEQSLRESDERLHFSLETSHTGAWDLDLVDHTAFRSLEHDRIFGYTELLPQWTYETFLEHVLPEDRMLVDGNFRRAVETQTDWSFECRIRRTDGQVRWIWAAGRHRRDAAGTAQRMAGIVQDITDLRKAQEALRESEERYRTVADFTYDWEFWIDPDGRFKYVSPSVERIVGLPIGQTDAAEDTLRRIVHPQDLKKRLAHLREEMKGNSPGEAEFRIVRSDGQIRWIHHVCRPIHDSQGRFLGTRGSNRDITEHKHAEALRLANSYNRSLIEASLDPLVTIGPDGKITDVNSATELATGCTRKELIGTDFSDYFTEPDKARAGYQQVFQEGSVRDYPLELRHRDGRIASVLYHASVYHDEMGNPVGVFAAARDITRRKQGEEALRRASAYNRSLIDASLDPLVTIGPDGKITDVNSATELATGCTREELIGTDFSDYFTEPDKAQAGYQQVFQEGSVRDYPLELRHHDGHVTSVLYHASVYRDEMGNPVGVFAAARDITAWRQAEEAVKIERQRLYDVMETLPVYVVLLSKDYHVPFANRFFRERFGESNGKRCFEYLFNRNEPCEICETYKVLKTHAPLGWEWTGPDGRNYDIHDFPFTDTDGSPMIMEMGIDVTDRQKAFEELERRASQLQRLTMELSQAEDRERHRLAQILHDDLQQLLVGAKLHLNILANKIHSGESKDAKTLLSQVHDLISESIDKSRSLSHELTPPLLYQGTLVDAMTWLAQRMQRTCGLTVDVDAGADADLSSDTLKAFAYKAAQEMLFNVVKHARVKRAKLQLRRLKGYVRLIVSDEGKGFDLNTLGKAGGFGLFSIQERSRLLGGWMKFKSTPGAGSIFVLAVPDAAAPATAEAVGQPADRQAVARHTARTRAAEREANHPLRVLLVDDHKVMREGVAALLDEQPDIEVVGQAGNGRDAISMTRKLQPDVVVMDVAMPILGGEEATRRIKSHWPQTRVIALSLSEETIVSKKMRKAGAECYLSKTDPSEKLLAAIRGQK